MKKSPYFTAVMLSVLVAWGGSRDTVSFTLTFADRPIPDMRGYEALWLTGEGVKSDLEYLLAVAYPWYGKALVSAKLDWKLTDDGYASFCCHGRRLSLGPNLTKEELTTQATEICREDDRTNRKHNLEGVSRTRLTGVVLGY